MPGNVQSDRRRGDGVRYFFEKATNAVPCSRCGCRLVSKLGRGKSLLICADCGHPLTSLVDPVKRRNTALAAFSLVGMVMVGSGVLMLDSIHNNMRQEGLPAESSDSEDLSGD